MPTVKPGYRTTEFYAAILAAVLPAVAAVADQLPGRYAAIAAAIVSAGYAISRGLAKRPAVVTTAPVTVQSVAPSSQNIPPVATASGAGQRA